MKWVQVKGVAMRVEEAFKDRPYAEKYAPKVEEKPKKKASIKKKATVKK